MLMKLLKNKEIYDILTQKMYSICYDYFNKLNFYKKNIINAVVLIMNTNKR